MHCRLAKPGEAILNDVASGGRFWVEESGCARRTSARVSGGVGDGGDGAHQGLEPEVGGVWVGCGPHRGRVPARGVGAPDLARQVQRGSRNLLQLRGQLCGGTGTVEIDFSSAVSQLL